MPGEIALEWKAHEMERHTERTVSWFEFLKEFRRTHPALSANEVLAEARKCYIPPKYGPESKFELQWVSDVELRRVMQNIEMKRGRNPYGAESLKESAREHYQRMLQEHEAEAGRQALRAREQQRVEEEVNRLMTLKYNDPETYKDAWVVGGFCLQTCPWCGTQNWKQDNRFLCKGE
jgi:hypothetical protein